MPLVCCLSEAVEADVFQGDGEAIVTIPIGYDDETHCVYSAVIALSPIIGAPNGSYEQVFYLLEYDPDSSTSHEYWDGESTRHFISKKDDRHSVLEAICTATDHLIQLVRPRIVSFMTHTQNLPDRALRKYETVASVYRRAGYDAREGEPYHGRRIWMAERMH